MLSRQIKAPLEYDNVYLSALQCGQDKKEEQLVDLQLTSHVRARTKINFDANINGQLS